MSGVRPAGTGTPEHHFLHQPRLQNFNAIAPQRSGPSLGIVSRKRPLQIPTDTYSSSSSSSCASASSASASASLASASVSSASASHSDLYRKTNYGPHCTVGSVTAFLSKRFSGKQDFCSKAGGLNANKQLKAKTLTRSEDN